MFFMPFKRRPKKQQSKIFKLGSNVIGRWQSIENLNRRRIILMSDIIKGSSNIFEDLGFDRQEAANLKIRADLMLDLRKFIRSKNWTQAEAAMFFGETQPRISNLMNGDIERFAIDKLVQMLSQAGMDVRVLVTAKANR
jgi:predicted XRE-type DNA-binding protein